MTITDFLFAIVPPLLFILFWVWLYISDRIKEAKIRRQFSKFEDHQEYEKPAKPWGIYIIGVLFALLFLYIILSRIEDYQSNIYSQGYEAGYEAGIEAGIDMVKEDPSEFLG